MKINRKLWAIPYNLLVLQVGLACLLISTTCKAEQPGKPEGVTLRSGRFQNLTLAADYANRTISGYYNPRLDSKLSNNRCHFMLYGELRDIRPHGNLPGKSEIYQLNVWNPSYPNEVHNAYLYSPDGLHFDSALTIQMPSSVPRNCRENGLFDVGAGATLNRVWHSDYPAMRVVRNNKAFFYEPQKGQLVKTRKYVVAHDAVFIDNLYKSSPNGYIDATYYNQVTGKPIRALIREVDLYHATNQ